MSLYTEELATEICDRLIAGESLMQICYSPGMPNRVTVIRWMGQRPEFATRCARARAEQADLMDDKMLELITKLEAGQLDPNAAKVILSALQWRAAKLAPRKYGERIEHAGEGGGPVRFVLESAATSRRADAAKQLEDGEIIDVDPE